jgi:hypothetical protein
MCMTVLTWCECVDVCKCASMCLRQYVHLPVLTALVCCCVDLT